MKRKILIVVGVIFPMILAYASHPSLSFIPLTATELTIPANEKAVVKYQVVNQSKKLHTLVMRHIPGITQVSTAGNCPNPIVLSYQQSCILNLIINGSTLKKNVTRGPILCSKGHPHKCYQPRCNNRLKITQAPAINYTVGGAVYGLLGTLVLSNNNSDLLTLNADGTFIFSNTLSSGSSYSVMVQTQPSSQTCTVSNSSGVITNKNVTNVIVNCSLNARTIGGTVSGLTTAESLVLQNNGEDILTVNRNGLFEFSIPVAQGAPYNVTVLNQPSKQTCTIMNSKGTVGESNITNVQVTCAPDAYKVGGSVSGLLGNLVLQNNHMDNLAINRDAAFSFATSVAEGASYNVTVLTQPAAQTCTVLNGSGIIHGANVTDVGVSCVTNTTTLSISYSDLALSVKGFKEYGVAGIPNSGVARVIKVSNTGGSVASGLNVAYSGLPPDTTHTTTCSATLASGNSCDITIIPGNTATSNNKTIPVPCSNGTAPNPGTVKVTADNANPVLSNVVVLSYGCIYQGGYVYAFDDTTPNNRSVGGKVVTTTDQAASYPNGIVWSSNGSTGHGNGGSDLMDVSYDTLPGISDKSASSAPSPDFLSFTTFFSQTYANPNPFTANSFRACKGRSDGFCNTYNIVRFYNQFISNYNRVKSPPYTAFAGPTNATYYAAGLCSGILNNYSDWYLPAICEMGYKKLGRGSNSGCGSSVSPTLQNMQSSLVDFNNLNLLAGYYWSSTEHSLFPDINAWNEYFAPGDSGINQDFDDKNAQFGVRCSRALTF